MNGWKKSISVATMLLVMTQTQSVLADAVRPAVAIPVMAVTQGQQLRITGKVQYVELEGGFYAVDGWRLIGDQEFMQYLGLPVIVVGTQFDGMSIQMVKAINVKEVFLGALETNPVRPVLPPIRAVRDLPASFTVDGGRVTFDQGPLLVDGVVMVPLRAVVTAAGGAIEWIESELTAKVDLNGRTVYFAVGTDASKLEASTGMEKVSMTRAPQLVAGRVLVSADALSSALGMSEIVNTTGTSLDLSTSQAPDRRTGFIGVVKEIEMGEKPRVLVVGDKMSSGEPSMTWVYVHGDTEIALYCGGVESQGTMDDFSVGQTVEVIITGPMNMSYPALAKADKIIIQDVQGAVLPEEENRLSGTIKDIETGQNTRILVAGGPMSSGETSLVWVTISSETKVASADGTVPEFEVGQQVDVLLTGPILMSYPGQGGAAEVNILGQAQHSEDIVGKVQELEVGDTVRILVDGNMLVWITVSVDTAILRETTTGTIDGAVSDLKVGTDLVVELTGPILKSHPAQGRAASILIKQ
ncbi:MAG: DUF3221 domain-containing protein [Peptococcaceae bacterium]|nr:DUF3221 domain-containing protein [Peptococcaceae bacterium]